MIAVPGRRYLTAVAPDFVWGAATAAYQIEGATTEDGRGPSIWDTFSRLAGNIRNGDTGDVACDHYHRWREDLTIAASLGLGAYRFSVSWVRLQPTGRGTLNRSGVGFYRSVLEYLHELGIRPVVTLYHWDLPQELEDVGGWPERDTAFRFAEYAQRTVEALGDLAGDWITLNESWCQAFNGYHLGVHAPGRRDLSAAVSAAHHLNLAGGLATQAIRSVRAEASVGIAHILTDVRPASLDPEDEAAARRVDANHNRLFLDPLLGGGYGEEVIELHGPHGLLERMRPGDDEVMAEAIDFLGVNHYQQLLASNAPDEPFLRSRIRAAKPAATSLGWSVRPESLYSVLVRVDREYGHIPLYVTENGACFEDYVGPDGEVRDQERIDYLDSYLAAAAQAASEGVDLRGYFAWSLLDNFEWAEGYSKRFGLVYVDYRTQERIPKASARWYRDLILQHRNLHVVAPAPMLQELATQPPTLSQQSIDTSVTETEGDPTMNPAGKESTGDRPGASAPFTKSERKA